MAKRCNVKQHVVPQCYLKHFADVNEKIHVREKATGRSFAAGTHDLCYERDAFTLIVDGKRNFSFEGINNDIESVLGPILFGLMGPVDLTNAEVQTRIFTHLAALTANFAARSRVLRNSMDASLDGAIQFLSKHPDVVAEFPEDAYQRFLHNPSAFREFPKRFPEIVKYIEVLRDCNKQEPAQSSQEVVECLKEMKRVQYAALLKVRSAAIVDLMVKSGAKADLLTNNTQRFITGDDPVIFLIDNRRQGRVVPTNVSHWSADNMSVFLPLNPFTAILWGENGAYRARPVSNENVRWYNAMVAENAIRHILAVDPADLLCLR